MSIFSFLGHILAQNYFYFEIQECHIKRPHGLCEKSVGHIH